MTGPPPDPSGPWPANGVMRWPIGERLTIRTKAGDVVHGRVVVRARERVWLVGDGGVFTVWTGAILSVIQHDARSRW